MLQHTFKYAFKNDRFPFFDTTSSSIESTHQIIAFVFNTFCMSKYFHIKEKKTCNLKMNDSVLNEQ